MERQMSEEELLRFADARLKRANVEQELPEVEEAAEAEARRKPGAAPSSVAPSRTGLTPADPL